MALKPTAEQINCISTAENNRVTIIQAVAGAGKTSTLTLMANAFPLRSLYICFNKAAADEAATKFPKHVECRTTHSIAFSEFGIKLRDKLTRPKGKYVNVAVTGGEIARFLKIQPTYARGSVVVSAAYAGLLVSRTVANFEQSGSETITKDHLPHRDLLDIADTHKIKTDDIAKGILLFAERLWKERIDPNSVVLANHDTYLKLYQLSKPELKYDIIYVDESQDSSGCVLAIIQNQKTQKIVLVGDSRQSIYQWRGSMDIMSMIPEGIQCRLSKSFRYGQAVAGIATEVLDHSITITGRDDIASVVGGMNIVDRTKPYTVLCRTNAYLLDTAINDLKANKKVLIDIDVKDFLRLLESAKALYLNDINSVKHERILPFNNWDELVEEGKNGGELKTISNILSEKREDDLIRILSVYEKPVIFDIRYTTSHKSKGAEFEQVILGNDFPSNYNQYGDWVGLAVPEQNLLYVACTRAIMRLEYNSTVAEILNRKEE